LCNKFHWFHKQWSDCSAIFLFLFTACYRAQQGRIQPVSLGGTISVIFGSQVSFAGSLL